MDIVTLEKRKRQCYIKGSSPAFTISNYVFYAFKRIRDTHKLTMLPVRVKNQAYRNWVCLKYNVWYT